MNYLKIVTVFLCLYLLIACDAKTEKDKENTQGKILDNQMRAYEKAREVEKVINEADENRRKIMEDQGI